MLQTSKNHYEAELKGDKVIVGDPLSADFIPKVVLKRCGEECSIVLDVPEVAGKLKGGKDCSVKDGKVSWATPDIEFNFFEKSPDEQNDGGSFEYEIVLKKKPPVNSVSIPINLKGLVAYYQPALTQEEIARGCVRPDNVVGSYAVYHATRSSMHKSQTDADKYKCGKAFHIYRPMLIDNAGNTAWADLTITGSALTIDFSMIQDWLNNAKYPVVIDPTFGYGSKGASSASLENTLLMGRFAPTDGDGTGDSISIFLYCETAAHLTKCNVYQDETGEADVAVAALANGQTEEISIAINYNDWQAFNFIVAPDFVNGVYYRPAAWAQATTGGIRSYYDTSIAGANIYYLGKTYGTWPDPSGTLTRLDDGRASVYCTYSTVPAAPAFKLKMIPKRPWNRMSRLYKSLSLKGG